MKIGILTFHQSVNNGAVMQAYSLSKRLKEEYPDDIVEIINYRKKSVDRVYSYPLSDYFKVSSLKELLKRAFDLFCDPKLLKRLRYRTKIFNDCQYKLPLSKDVILSDDTEDLNKYIDQNYDVLIVGSDAVWNYVSRDFPNAYFPSNELRVKKLSYAASCYGMDFLNGHGKNRNKICDILSGFDFIGVRDAATEDFVKWSGCKIPPRHTCDPTAFLDVNDLPIDTENLKNKLLEKGFDFNKPTIGMMGSDKMLSMIRKLYSNKYQIASLYNYHKEADVNLYDLQPYEWAYVFRYFKLTFTTFFHGTLLSLRNGVPVICIDLDTEFGKRHTPKTLDALTRLGLENCYFKTDYKTLNFEAIKNKADELITGEYYDSIIEAINKEAQSFDVFNSALKSIIGKDKGI